MNIYIPYVFLKLCTAKFCNIFCKKYNNFNIQCKGSITERSYSPPKGEELVVYIAPFESVNYCMYELYIIFSNTVNLKFSFILAIIHSPFLLFHLPIFLLILRSAEDYIYNLFLRWLSPPFIMSSSEIKLLKSAI